MPYVDYKHVRNNVPIEVAAEWLGLKLKKANDQLRGPCPIHGGERSLVITPAKGLFYCFAPECMAGGDVIALVEKVRQISTREAALALQEHFLDPHHKVGSVENPLSKIDYLQPDHHDVQALGIDKDTARILGIGYAPRGTMAKRVLLPLRNEQGKLVGYIGISPGADVKIPSKWHL